MRETVDHLREKWYGNHHCQHDVYGFVNGDYKRKKEESHQLQKDFSKSCENGEQEIYTCVCRTLGEVTFDPDHGAEQSGVPVDILNADLVQND